MFTNGPRLGEARYEIGDADMNEETSLNLDRSVRIDLSRFRDEIAAYRNRIDNHIFVTPTAELRNGLRVFRYGQSNATLVGGEASAEAIAARALTVRGRYDVVKATNDETDEPLALIPARSGAIEAELHRNSLGWAEQACFGVEAEIVADKTRFAFAEEPTAGYTLFHVEAGAQHPWGRPPASHRLAAAQRLRQELPQLPQPLQGVRVGPGPQPHDPGVNGHLTFERAATTGETPAPRCPHHRAPGYWSSSFSTACRFSGENQSAA